MAETEGIANQILYAVAPHEDGSITLTVFDGSGSAAVDLSLPLVGQLIEMLQEQVQNEKPLSYRALVRRHAELKAKLLAMQAAETKCLITAERLRAMSTLTSLQTKQTSCPAVAGRVKQKERSCQSNES
jgi:hypothetical protein